MVCDGNYLDSASKAMPMETDTVRIQMNIAILCSDALKGKK